MILNLNKIDANNYHLTTHEKYDLVLQVTDNTGLH